MESSSAAVVPPAASPTLSLRSRESIGSVSAVTAQLAIEDTGLLSLVRDARQLYEASVGNQWLVSPGAPVLFFGDLPEYAASSVRIATVALNPSREEFPKVSPFSRFPNADLPDDALYLHALFAYFRTRPYWSWFDCYEQALLGMAASYYGGSNSTALHTDICSVLPTDPTWSKLFGYVRRQLVNDGVGLWHRLVEYIQPNILLWSTACKWLGLMALRPIGEWTQLATFNLTKHGVQRTRPVGIEARWYSLSTGAPLLVAHGPALEKPLAGLSHELKQEVGRIVKEYWSHGS